MTNNNNTHQSELLDDQWLADLMHAGLDDEQPSAELVSRTVAAMNDAVSAQPAKPAFTAVAGAKPRKQPRGMRMRRAISVAVAACLCCCLVGGGIAYAGETAEVDLSYGSTLGTALDDSAPQVRLCLNRFDRVVRAEGLNEAGKQAVQEHSVWGQSCEQATSTLLGSWQGQADAVDAVSIEVRCEDGNQSERLRQGCEGQAEKHGFGAHGQAGEQAGLGAGNGVGQGNGEGNGAGQGNGEGQGQGNGQGGGNGSGQGEGSGHGHGAQNCD